MTLDRDRPEILTPPEHPQACCTQQTITVPPDVNAKTRQKHDYPSAAWRRSYARRTGAERGFATAKDPASNDIARGWCRLMGLAPLMLFTATLLVVRNQRILAAWNTRQEENPPRRQGLPPKTRRRRRKTLTALTAAALTPAGSRPAPAPPQHDTRAAHAARPDTEATTPGTAKGRLRRPSERPDPSRTTVPPGMSDPNVKIGLTRNVKTSAWSLGDSNP